MDIYINRRAEYEWMRSAIESDEHTAHYLDNPEDYPADRCGDSAARIECSDESLTLIYGDWGASLPVHHTEGAAFYALGWIDGYNAGLDD